MEREWRQGQDYERLASEFVAFDGVVGIDPIIGSRTSLSGQADNARKLIGARVGKPVHVSRYDDITNDELAGPLFIVTYADDPDREKTIRTFLEGYCGEPDEPGFRTLVPHVKGNRFVGGKLYGQREMRRTRRVRVWSH